MNFKNMANKIFVDGFRTFAPHPNAPDWALGTLVIDVDAFKKFIENQSEHFTQYQGKDQLKIQITKLKNDDRLSFSVDTYKPQSKPEQTATPQRVTEPIAQATGGDLPF